MVDFKKVMKEDRMRNIKIFLMDTDGYQYWAGRSAESCFEHMTLTQGSGDGMSSLAEVVEVSAESMNSLEMQMDDGRILTFRKALDELIELEVKFPRFFCGSEE